MAKISMAFYAQKCLSGVPGFVPSAGLTPPVPGLVLKADEKLAAAIVQSPAVDCWIVLTDRALHLHQRATEKVMNYDVIHHFIFPPEKADWNHLIVVDNFGRELTVHLPKADHFAPICNLHRFLSYAMRTSGTKPMSSHKHRRTP